jgi:alkyl sulfatase BDS1-like metallo-beta-lactamase superfamily hydrolase
MIHRLALLALLAAPLHATPTASPATIAANKALADTLNWDDKQDFDFASRGFVAGPIDMVVKDKDGTILPPSTPACGATPRCSPWPGCSR